VLGCRREPRQGEDPARAQQPGGCGLARPLQAALRHPWDAGAVGHRQDRVARLHPADQLGCGGAGRARGPGHAGPPPGMSASLRAVPPSRASRPSRYRQRLETLRRQATIFGAGFLSGALALFLALLGTGGLKPPDTRRPPAAPPADRPAPEGGATVSGQPEASRQTVLPPPAPRAPGDSTDAVLGNAFARPPDLWASPAPMASDLE